MTGAQELHLETYAAALADSLTGVVQELHAIDPLDLVSFIRFGSFAALEDLLQASTELFFKDGTLRFGWTAAAEVVWDGVPTVTLGMEFQNGAVSVFFDLSLCALKHSVAIAGVHFDDALLKNAESLGYFSGALADARLPTRIPLVPAPSPRA